MSSTKRTDFLVKLHREGKLWLVEPNETLKSAYVEKSISNLESARILFENNKLEEPVILAYYSMYHVVMALLFRIGIRSANHTASIILLKRVFGIDNSVLSFAKNERIDKQYYTDFHITKNEVTNVIDLAEEFNKKLSDFISKLNAGTINEYRNRFKACCP